MKRSVIIVGLAVIIFFILSWADRNGARKENAQASNLLPAGWAKEFYRLGYISGGDNESK